MNGVGAPFGCTGICLGSWAGRVGIIGDLNHLSLSTFTQLYPAHVLRITCALNFCESFTHCFHVGA